MVAAAMNEPIDREPVGCVSGTGENSFGTRVAGVEAVLANVDGLGAFRHPAFDRGEGWGWGWGGLCG